jgi:hypothetical protein
VSTSRIVRLATASLIGTTLEYYDFAVYSTLAALVFNRLFFPFVRPDRGLFWPCPRSPLAISPAIGGVILNLGERWSPLRARDSACRHGRYDGDDRSVKPTNREIVAPVLLVVFVSCRALPSEEMGRAILLCVEHGWLLSGVATVHGRSRTVARHLDRYGLLAWITAVLSPASSGMGLALPFLSVLLVIFGLWIRQASQGAVYQELDRSGSSHEHNQRVVKLHWRLVAVLVCVSGRMFEYHWWWF